MKKIYTVLFLFLLVLFGFSKTVFGQDYTWWNTHQNWDGVTPWHNYIIYSPDYMGPNALPVPFSEKGRVQNRIFIRFYTDAHFHPGDKTQDFGGRLYVPIVSGVVAIEAWGIIQEHYQMTEAEAIRRRVRHQKAEGFAVGDAYFATVIRLLKGRKFPDMAFRIGLRTASGGNLYDARFTDTPGYFFDLSLGKNLTLGLKDYVRINAMLGFYSWQTNLAGYHQDDAVLYGLGADFHIQKSRFNISIDGYSGYVGNDTLIIVNPEKPVSFHDRPLVFRAKFEHWFGNWKPGVQYQLGLHDFQYQSVRLEVSYYLPEDFLKQKKKTTVNQ
jgi:hypothetical protein